MVRQLRTTPEDASPGCPLAIARLCQRRRGAKQLFRKTWWRQKGRRGTSEGMVGPRGAGYAELCGAMRARVRNKKQKQIEAIRGRLAMHLAMHLRWQIVFFQ